MTAVLLVGVMLAGCPSGCTDDAIVIEAADAAKAELVKRRADIEACRKTQTADKARADTVLAAKRKQLTTCEDALLTAQGAAEDAAGALQGSVPDWAPWVVAGAAVLGAAVGAVVCSTEDCSPLAWGLVSVGAPAVGVGAALLVVSF